MTTPYSYGPQWDPVDSRLYSLENAIFAADTNITKYNNMDSPIITAGEQVPLAIQLFFSVGGMLTNGVLVATIFSHRSIRSQLSNCLIMVLAINDFFNSINGTLCFGLTTLLGHFPRQDWFCELIGFSYPFFCMNTFFVLAVLTTERYQLLVKGKKMKKKHALNAIYVFYAFNLILSLMPTVTGGR